MSHDSPAFLPTSPDSLERENSLEPTRRAQDPETYSELSSDDSDEEGYLISPGDSTPVGGAEVAATDAASAGNEPLGSPSPFPSDVGRRRRRRRRRHQENMKKSGLRKKLRFLTDLLTCLDSLVFMELGTFYYLECSLWRFCMRAILHYVFLTPKSESFPFLMPAAQSHIVSIFLPNMMCFLLHLFSSLPRASRELHRGYLHGGVLADFVGQKPPSSRLPLLLLDCVVLLMQCLMLAVHSDREELRGTMRRFIPFGNGGGDGGGADRRGVVGLGFGRLAVADDFAARAADAAREAGETAQSQQDMEGGSSDDDDDESEQAESSPTDHHEDTVGDTQDGDQDGDQDDARLQRPEAVADALLHDVLNSGLGILGEFNIIHTLRTASMDFESAAAHSLRTLGYTATLTALAARRGSVPIGTPRQNNNPT